MILVTRYYRFTINIVIISSFISCQYLGDLRDKLEARLGLRQGVPLTEFQARDRDYFPLFLKKFFPKIYDFEHIHRDVVSASADIQIIQVKRLTEKAGRYNEANLSWSADGVYLGYEVIDASKRQILVKDLGDSYTKLLLKLSNSGENRFLEGMTKSSIHAYNAGLRWSKDSTRYAFMSNGGIGVYNIYVGAVGEHEKIIARSDSKEGFVSWSPVRAELGFVSSRSGNGDIYVVESGGDGLCRLSNDDDVDIFPDWFPDGNAIVYASGNALDHDLKLVRRISRGVWSRPIKLTDWSVDEIRPIVSPNGLSIAFYAEDEVMNEFGSRSWNLHVIPTRWISEYNLPLSSKLVKKSLVARNVMLDISTGPAFSPDSRKIFYVKRNERSFNPIEVVNLDTGHIRLLETKTKMNRDVMISSLGVLSFRAQEGAWDRVYLALTNQGEQLQRLEIDKNIRQEY